MNTHSVRFFKLSPSGKGRGVSCDANGAFIDDVPLLKRAVVNGKEKWMPRDSDELSAALSRHYALPIDISSKAAGISAIARALSEDAVVLAQLAALFLRFPEPPPFTKTAQSRHEWIRFIRQLGGR